MATGVRVEMTRGVKNLGSFEKRINSNFGKVLFKYARMMRDSIRMEFMRDPKRSPGGRSKSRNLIRLKKVSELRSEIRMPSKLIFLDSARPHFVALKPGRLVTKWAKKHYGKRVMSGLSKVRKGSKGGILWSKSGFKSQLYFTPHPFIVGGMERVFGKLPVLTSEAVRVTIAGG